MVAIEPLAGKAGPVNVLRENAATEIAVEQAMLKAQLSISPCMASSRRNRRASLASPTRERNSWTPSVHGLSVARFFETDSSSPARTSTPHLNAAPSG